MVYHVVICHLIWNGVILMHRQGQRMESKIGGSEACRHTHAHTNTHARQLYAKKKQSASAKLFILIKNKWYGCPVLQPLACHSISMQIQLHGSLSIIPLWVAGRPVAAIGKGILVEQSRAKGESLKIAQSAGTHHKEYGRLSSFS